MAEIVGWYKVGSTEQEEEFVTLTIRCRLRVWYRGIFINSDYKVWAKGMVSWHLYQL